MKLPKLIVFDMDGVLIDVSNSYRETVRKTVRLFFEGANGFEQLPDPLFPLTDIARLKQTGGLNNDWELTARAIHLLFSLVKTPIDFFLTDDHPDHELAIHGCDVLDLARFLNSSPSPLMDLLNRHGKRNNPFVTACFQGDVGTGNVIKRIFQEIYLGRSLFSVIYGIESRFYRKEGLIHRESPLMDHSILENLTHDHILAIATGRPRAEADFSLDRFDLRKYFQIIITLEDCTQEEERIFNEHSKRISLQKPNPYMLDQIPDLIGKAFDGCYYLGDMPDDMQAARSSKTGYRGVGVILASPDRETLRNELLRSGADHIITDYKGLLGIIS
jgi:HAD superfamily hydrolase (TIGR01548 family)